MSDLSEPSNAHIFLSRSVRWRMGWLGVVGVLGASLLSLTLSILQFSSVQAFQESSHSALNELSLTSEDSPVTAWQYVCASERLIVNGVGIGDGREVLTNPQTISLSASIISEHLMLAQVAGRLHDGDKTSIPESIVITTNDIEAALIGEEIIQDQHGYSYGARFQTSNLINQITATLDGSVEEIQSARGLILYSMAEEPGQSWTSVGQITNEYAFINSSDQKSIVTKTIVLPSSQPVGTKLFVTAIVVDNDNDNRSLELIIAAGGDSVTVSEENSTHGDLLNIIEVELTTVLTGTDHVDIILKSPAPNGDSIVLSGVNVSHPCGQNETFSYMPLIFKPLPLNVDIKFDSIRDLDSGIVGFPVTQTITVANNLAHKTAPSLTLTYELPAEVIPDPTRPNISSNAACSGRRTITCGIGALPPNSVFSTNIYLLPIQDGTMANEVNVYSEMPGANAGGRATVDYKLEACVPSRVDDNDFDVAIGPLLSGISYCGKLNDQDDYYFITLPSAGTLTTKLRVNGRIPPKNKHWPLVQLATYSRPTKSSLITYTPKYKSHLELSTVVQREGKYYLRVYTTDYWYNIPYTLSVEFTP